MRLRLLLSIASSRLRPTLLQKFEPSYRETVKLQINPLEDQMDNATKAFGAVAVGFPRRNLEALMVPFPGFDRSWQGRSAIPR
jgi:hypothetical protein